MPRDILRSQRLRMVNHQGDALRLGMNWTEEDLGKPQVLVDSADGQGHPGTFHFRSLIEEVSTRHHGGDGGNSCAGPSS
jgi:dihydroxy-acid dehydratase